jgi:hypothetical protein
MKMGTTRSPFPYDAAARRALQSINLRRPSTLGYASRAPDFPHFAGWSGYPSIAAMPINPRIDVMCKEPTSAPHASGGSTGLADHRKVAR